MFVRSPRAQIVIGIALATLMAVTRGHHFGTLEHLPSASWAVFFLAGLYLSSRWVFPALLAEAALLDVAAVTWGGVDNFCVSPAYASCCRPMVCYGEPATGTQRVTGRMS